MLARWPIRYKLMFGVAMVFLIVAILSFSGFRGVYSYRGLVRSISMRADEIPAAATLTQAVDNLRFVWRRVGDWRDVQRKDRQPPMVREEFQFELFRVNQALHGYKEQLEKNESTIDPVMGDKQSERETVERIEAALVDLEDKTATGDWILKEVQFEEVRGQLDELSELASSLPLFLQTRMRLVRDEVRGQYRTWIILAWATTILTGIMLILLARFFYQWVFQPLRVIIDGSRRVAAAGDFNHRIELHSHDEMAELARGMNNMTARFREIRDDLDEQVKQRTNEAIRSEKMASVGFLAAGVAHEINNPLASIAWCAESLESRLQEIQEDSPQITELDEFQILQRYLRTIQDEAFRCKGITDQLLDFSRTGDSNKQQVDICDLVRNVIDMVQHLGKYRNKDIRFHGPTRIEAVVNAQELKQVTLNLVTNALDSLEDHGQVDVELEHDDDYVYLRVMDNGCGMAEETLKHIFEPFFTRRDDGQGTGLGLSITFRIIEEHGGSIRAHSDGPNAGSTFVVTLPLKNARVGHEREYKAA